MIIRKLSAGLLIFAALYSGNVRQLLGTAANAADITTVSGHVVVADCDNGGGGSGSSSGATCN